MFCNLKVLILTVKSDALPDLQYKSKEIYFPAAELFETTFASAFQVTNPGVPSSSAFALTVPFVTGSKLITISDKSTLEDQELDIPVLEINNKSSPLDSVLAVIVPAVTSWLEVYHA